VILRLAVLVELQLVTDGRTDRQTDQGRSQEFEFRGLKPMASAEREPITGIWGQSPQRGPGAEPLVAGQGGKAP